MVAEIFEVQPKAGWKSHGRTCAPLTEVFQSQQQNGLELMQSPITRLDFDTLESAVDLSPLELMWIAVFASREARHTRYLLCYTPNKTKG